jgi:rhamnosyltransferase
VTAPAASVIVRAKDEARTIGHTLSLLRDQTVVPEVIVVDSGSTDGTLEIARRACDRLIEIPPHEFTFGRALNVGARAATAPVHFALSAHCCPERPDWIERSLTHYERDDVAATAGARALPDGSPLRATLRQDAEHARSHPYWGFSNHASSWRASVWERFPFDEHIEAAEDRDWAFRVLDAGWVIAIDPALWVGMSHVWRSGLRSFYRRRKREARALATFAPLDPYGLRECLREWWSELPDDRHSPLLHRLDYRRIAGLAGRYAGHRAARSDRSGPARRRLRSQRP